MSLRHQFDQQHEGAAGYVDIVQVALWQAGYHGRPETAAPVAACQHLGVDVSVNLMDNENHRRAIEQTVQTLSAV